jgi:hypothetical protein
MYNILLLGVLVCKRNSIQELKICVAENDLQIILSREIIDVDLQAEKHMLDHKQRTDIYGNVLQKVYYRTPRKYIKSTRNPQNYCR